MNNSVSIKGLNKADVLAALYNRAQPQGMGFMQYDPKPMSREEAQKILSKGASFDYLKGRVMKVDLTGEEFSAWGYDRDNGQGAAAEAIEMLRKTGNVNPVTTQAAHHTNTVAAAEDVKTRLGDKSGWETPDTFRLGLDDVAPVLGPKIDQALEKQRGQ